MAAVQLMVENLRTIESFLRTRRLWRTERYTIALVPRDPYEPDATGRDRSGVNTPARPAQNIDPQR
ncbi:hypothetical protein CP970_25440 [Streptomyces kanamyceticus]|uniref:Uncharacterized protein n=1 Tax=Streptomyces kanamyceticus TaxID=1967 RepID=A0A5J6GJ01_STRKN|nr:hypothetical protein CP970_25440 [Streptomyces kanamyceticus]